MFNYKERIRTIWFFAKKYIPFFVVAEICIVLIYAISVLLPVNLAFLTDDVLYKNNFYLLPKVIVNYIILFLISAAANFIYAFVWQFLNNHYVLDVKNDMFKKIITAKASFLSNINSGDIMLRIDGDSEQFINIIQRNIFHFINSFIMCAAILIIVFKINAAIALMLICAGIIPIIITKFFGKKIEKIYIKQRDIFGKMSGRVYEIIKGLREIKLFNSYNFAEKQFFVPLKKVIELNVKGGNINFLSQKITGFINLFFLLCIYGFSAFLILNKKLTIGMFLAIVNYISLLQKKFNWILNIYLDLNARKVCIDRVNEILKIEPEKNEGIKISSIKSVEFKNVGFGYYKNSDILKDINFSVKNGEKVGLVGASGNGKTTISSLLLGFYSLNYGNIFINNIPINKISVLSLREKIGMVSQEISIFEDSIRYNLCLGKNYSDEEIFNALKDVDLFNDIKKMPEGIDTVISQTSCNLSGGQKQRIMIARVILKNPEFIILDEATSALDVKTEKAIIKRFDEKFKNSAILIISHRLETIKNCNKIFVLNNKKTEISGTHKKLLKTSDTYASLFGGNNI